MIAMVAVTAVIVAALVITNATAGDDVSIAPDTWFAPAAPDRGATPVEAIESPRAVIARLDPPGEPALLDRFDRDRIDGGDGGDLGWTTLAGDWTLGDDDAEDGDDGARVASAAPGSDGAAVAVMVPPPSLGARWDLFARVARPADNMGLTWAVADADNYWEVRLATSNAAIVVNRVTDGQPQQLGLYGPAGVNPGDALHIQRVGDQVIVAVDDHILGSWAHPELADLRRAGIFAGSGGQGGFGSVLVTGDG